MMTMMTAESEITVYAAVGQWVCTTQANITAYQYITLREAVYDAGGYVYNSILMYKRVYASVGQGVYEAGGYAYNSISVLLYI